MDILLNPHYNNKGVLPFKLLEYVATGRTVISGPLNLSYSSLDWLLDGIILVDLKAKLWFDEILKFKKGQNLNYKKLENIRKKTIKLYSYEQFGKNLYKIINNLN